MIALAWIIFAAVIVAILLLNIIIVRYFNHRSESEFFPTTVAVISLTLTLLCVGLIPVDIYSVSMENPATEIFTAIKVMYYALYCAVLLFAFLIIPFAYFWYEAKDNETYGCRRVWDAAKFTLGFLLIIIILIIVGLFVQANYDRDGTPENFQKWVETILDVGNRGEGALLFSIGIATMIGYLFYITYAAYGLSALPIGLLKGKRSVTEEFDEYDRTKSRAEDRRRLIDERDRDERAADRIRRQERAAESRAERLAATAKGCCFCIQRCLRPFGILFGIIFLLISLALVASVILGAVDRVLHSYCGAGCGFILKLPMIWNPIDMFLVILSRVFPLDFVMVALLVVYFYFATLKGLTRAGIRFLWIQLYAFKKRHTLPQGLLIGGGIMMFCVLALNMQLVSLAPRYAYWGSQTWIPPATNGTEPNTEKQPCSIDGVVDGSCRMTQVGEIVSKIMLRGQFFSFVFYWITWVFIAFWLVGVFIAACQKADSNVEEHSDDEYEDESINSNDRRRRASRYEA